MTGIDRNRLDLDAGELKVSLIRYPMQTIAEERLPLLLDQCVEVARGGFGNPNVTESDVRIHALEVEYGAFVFEDNRCTVFSSAELLDLGSGPMIYMAGSVIGPAMQGRGAYELLNVLRLALGSACAAQWWGTRTQSPRVCQAFRKFGSYPFDDADDAAHASVAQELAQLLYDEKSDYQRPGGMAFDPQASVMQAAYEQQMYPIVPAASDAIVLDYFDRSIDMGRGDAAILVGTMERASAAGRERCPARFGLQYDELVGRLAGLAKDSA